MEVMKMEIRYRHTRVVSELIEDVRFWKDTCYKLRDIYSSELSTLRRMYSKSQAELKGEKDNNAELNRCFAEFLRELNRK
jgi:hypothetical protein